MDKDTELIVAFHRVCPRGVDAIILPTYNCAICAAGNDGYCVDCPDELFHACDINVDGNKMYLCEWNEGDEPNYQQALEILCEVTEVY